MIEILMLGVKPKFIDWISTRGGVQVWTNQEIGADRGNMFTPHKSPEGEVYDKPHWAYAAGELVTDITRFRFVKEMKEVKRLKITLDRRMNGSKVMLTSGSSRKVRAELDKLKEEHKVEPVYEFDGNEAVFSIPVFEE